MAGRRACAIVTVLLLILIRHPRGFAACVGDCNTYGQVTVDEILVGVNVVLGAAPINWCATLDANGDGTVTVDELLSAVNDVLNDCSAESPTPSQTATMTAASPTATVTPARGPGQIE